jgi:hypothetical protein
MELGVLQCEEPSLKLDHRLHKKFEILELKLEVLFTKKFKVGTKIESSFEK